MHFFPQLALVSALPAPLVAIFRPLTLEASSSNLMDEFCTTNEQVGRAKASTARPPTASGALRRLSSFSCQIPTAKEPIGTQTAISLQDDGIQTHLFLLKLFSL